MCKKANYILIIGLVFLIGCGDDSGNMVSEPRLSQNELAVIENCHILQEAVERFREQYDLLCPNNIGQHTTYCGETVVDLLPNGVLFENPYTQAATEPADGYFGIPGQVSYEPIEGYAITVGYRIIGVGDETDKVLIELNLYDDEREQKVVAACMTLYSTYLSQFVGRYPVDLSVESTTGKTLQEYIGVYPNPYSNEGTTLVLGIAHNPGEVGYLPVKENDEVVGCIITGVGEIENEIIFYIKHPHTQPCH